MRDSESPEEEERIPDFSFNRVLVVSPGALATAKYTNWLLFVVLTKEYIEYIIITVFRKGPMKTATHKPHGSIRVNALNTSGRIPILWIIIFLEPLNFPLQTSTTYHTG